MGSMKPLKYQKCFPGASPYKDRHGVRRWRFRSKGFSAELGTEYGSDDFVARYEAAQRQERLKRGVGARRTKPGSFDALVASWYRSPEFRNLGASTQRTYRNVVEKLREAHGPKPISQLERRHIIGMMSEKADTPAAANFVLRMMRQLLSHAVDINLRPDNPTHGIKKYRGQGKGFHTWSDDEIARYYAAHVPGSTAHTAMTIMLYTGASRTDAVQLGWGNCRDGRLKYRRQKTKGTSDVLIDIPIHAELQKVLDTLPRDAFTFLETRAGCSRSPNGLGNKMRAWCDAAGLPKCTSHGLRKACARRLAEAGATPHEIQAVTGHITLSEVERYTRDADRTALADSGFAKLGSRENREQDLANHHEKFAKSGNNQLKIGDKS